MAEGGERRAIEPTSAQLRLLARALDDPPRQLVLDFGSREKVIEAALADAPAIVAETDDAWVEGDAIERRVLQLERPGIGFALMKSANNPGHQRAAWAVGVVSVTAFLLTFSSPTGTVIAQVWRTAALVGAALLLLKPTASLLLAFFPRRVPGPLGQRLWRWAEQLPSYREPGLALLVIALFVLLYSVTAERAATETTLRLLAMAATVSAGVFLVLRDSVGGARLREVQVARERLRAERRAYEGQLRASALRRLRQRLGIEGRRSEYGTTLNYRDHSGLGEMDDRAREVDTRSKEQLLRAMARMPGGTIGISGSRGAGKTTLLHAVCAAEGSRRKERRPLGVVVDAPVRYDARDFILYLFAQVCTEVVGRDQVQRMRGSDRPFGYPALGLGILTQARWLFGFACLLAGAAVTSVAAAQAAELLAEPLTWGGLLLFVGFASIGVSMLEEGMRRRRLAVGAGVSEATSNQSDPNIHTAILRLRQIWFQQSFSSGWSGGLKAPFGIEGGVEVSTELAEQQLSLPDVVDLFRGFLKELAGVREVRIGIDELDKMDDETARRFLNEIKVVFRIPDCFFLISISEDAMSFFERRGLPIRDVFDSSFDDVLHVPQLEFAVSRELLERRIVELPRPFACLLHCISGGLPRDLIRAARDLLDLDLGTDLSRATALLLDDSLRSKAAAAKVATRAFRHEDHVTLLVNWIDHLLSVDFDDVALLGVAARFERDFLGALAGLPADPDLAEERRELQALATQLVASAYYMATMLQFFARFTETEFVDAAVSADAGREAPVDRLAAVTQAFAADLNTAWGALTEFREDLELGAGIPFPRVAAEAGGDGAVALGSSAPA